MDTILEVENLEKKFGDLIAVNSVSFKVQRGEIFGFLGPNGAGKTTTIRMMCGLLKPDRGKVMIHCENKRKSIGVCPQNIVIWENLTCLEQLVYMGQMYNIPTSESKKRSFELLDSLGLLEKKDKLAKTLSGGMQRRLNIALALIHKPEIVFLDEPQAGLDPQSRLLVRDYIRTIKKNTTIILSTHDMEEAEKLSDRVCIIDKGRTLIIGSIETIRKETDQKDIIEVDINGNIQKDLIPYLNHKINHFQSTSESSAFISIDDPLIVFEDILRVVNQRNIKINNLRLREKSLEDIFIHLTGRSLRE